ncbi:PaaX family transcriptional regulator [Actinomadura darangshiensis]|uniref:PaaX family transcriptional regulator n=1 Tax=Actinomadura darangshiensis TaxID=705336 RepID=A0A4R5A5A2_9ACTN|nr:PaaX family transcriptional regulator C-terminal domain-containing protein [Actinomadura darangshiensis]TDD65814.1 PaaX family transcriptional regulator [Actinomadura darangshiensis]
MNARSALFDLYGDHLRERGGNAPVAALVRLMAALGVAAPAVRTAVSRMVRQEWLEPVRLAQGPGYALTPRGLRRMDDAGRRVYRELGPWDGTWHVLVVERVRERARRDRLTSGLAYLGYARLDETTWIGPRASPELDPLLAAESVRAERFRSSYEGDAQGLVARAWDLDGLARSYERWLADAEEAVRAEPAGSDERAFALRSGLVHEWRKFLFRDPGLPPDLLPPGWPGTEAARFFDAEAARLLPAASRFVDGCLGRSTRDREDDDG